MVLALVGASCLLTSVVGVAPPVVAPPPVKPVALPVQSVVPQISAAPAGSVVAPSAEGFLAANFMDQPPMIPTHAGLGENREFDGVLSSNEVSLEAPRSIYTSPYEQVRQMPIGAGISRASSSGAESSWRTIGLGGAVLLSTMIAAVSGHRLLQVRAQKRAAAATEMASVNKFAVAAMSGESSGDAKMNATDAERLSQAMGVATALASLPEPAYADLGGNTLRTLVTCIFSTCVTLFIAGFLSADLGRTASNGIE